jgi:CRISPR-associated protein Csm3
MTQSLAARDLQLAGRAIITGSIRAITGLRVGSSDKGIGIGDAAQVLRDPLTNRPYIPGSSLRGKLRSLAERARWSSLSAPGDVQRVGNAGVHRCSKEAGQRQYEDCPICPVFGTTSDHPHATPTRLLVRDLFLSDESATLLQQSRTELPFTEVKTEVAIDRITAASNPRDIERVPADASFSGLNLSFAIYQDRDATGRFAVLPHAMALLEDDYLGGHGARGYGRVRFEDLTLTVRRYRGTTVHDTNLVEGGLVADLERAELPREILQAVRG